MVNKNYLCNFTLTIWLKQTVKLMEEKEIHTEEKILNAAREVFIEKGMAGARMQEIADKAGINKSLLHYYFRSKEKLFSFIFSKLIGKIGSRIGELMEESVSIEEKLKGFVDMYIDLLLNNPYLPNFIFNEITRNPDGLLQNFHSANINPREYMEPLQKQLSKEGYTILPHDFIINILSMVIFPVAARPIIERLVFEGNKDEYKQYILSRKESIVKYVMGAMEVYKQK